MKRTIVIINKEEFKISQISEFISIIIIKDILLYLHGIIKRVKSKKLTSIINKKKRGVVDDLFMSFKGVLIIKHEQTLGCFRIYLSSFYKDCSEI